LFRLPLGAPHGTPSLKPARAQNILAGCSEERQRAREIYRTPRLVVCLSSLEPARPLPYAGQECSEKTRRPSLMRNRDPRNPGLRRVSSLHGGNVSMERSEDHKRTTWRERAQRAREQIAEWRALRALVRRFGVHSAEVDDIAQEAALALHRADSPLERRALAWGIARRLSMRHRRRSALHGRAMEDASRLASSPPEPTPEDRVFAHDTAAILERAITALRAAEPTLYEVLMHHLEGLSVVAIAKRIGVPEGTAYNRLRRAREEIRATVQRETAAKANRAQRVRLMTGARRRWS